MPAASNLYRLFLSILKMYFPIKGDRMRYLRCIIVFSFLFTAGDNALGQGAVLPAPEDRTIRGIMFPAVSPDAKSICFSYLGDLWTVSVDGGRAARLTVHEAHDGFPRYSPDGRWIAFASNRNPATIYNYDIYIIPAGGGA